MWFKKKRNPEEAAKEEPTVLVVDELLDPAADEAGKDDEDPVILGLPDPVASLSDALATARMKLADSFVSIESGAGDRGAAGNRSRIVLSDDKKTVEWRVESLQPLFRGDRRPLPIEEMEHYPPEYVRFFHGIERNVVAYCKAHAVEPRDDEFIEIYTQMRRRPDGKSLGPLHDVVWQSAAFVLGSTQWSEAEYMAVFAQLARSARHFRLFPSSRNYIGYVKSTLGRFG